MSTTQQAEHEPAPTTEEYEHTEAGPFVRRDVWNLQPDGAPVHPVIEAYGRAVAELKRRSAPGTSWTWQAQIHGMFPDPQDGLRAQCQHTSWYFVLWHRVYLYHFEAICRSIITADPEISDEVKETWALPYWNYDRGPATDPARGLPLAFRSSDFGTGTPNPLFEVRRNPGINSGARVMPPQNTTAQGWFFAQPFASAVPNVPTFGGPVTGFVHAGGPGMGALERTPHGDVHVLVGGLMSSFETAGLDPVFWLHHANVDRLWEVWRTHTGAGDDPAPADLPERFEFLDVTGRRVVVPWDDVLDTRRLGYTYEDTGVPDSVRQVQERRELVQPRRPAPPVAGRHLEEPDGGAARRDERPPEAIAANDSAVRLRRVGSEEVDLELGDRERRRALRATGTPDDGEPERLILVLEHITAVGGAPSTTYSVYAGTDGDEASFVGTLPLFGITEAAGPEADHGLTYTFDITDLARDLRALGRWDPERLHLSFRSSDEETGNLGPTGPRASGDGADGAGFDGAGPDAGEPEIVVESVRLLVQ